MRTEEFDNHPVWVTLDNLQEVISRNLEAEDAESRDAVHRVHSVAQYVDGLRGVDPGLVDAATLNALDAAIGQVRDHVNTYLSDTDGNGAFLTSNAVSSAVEVMNTARQLMPAPPADAATRAAEAAAAHFKDSLDAELTALREVIDGLKRELVAAGEQRAADSEAAQQSLADLQTRIAEGEEQVSTQTTQLQQQIDNQRTAFQEEADQRAATFKETETQREAAASKQVTDAEEVGEQARTSQKEEADALIAELEKYRKQASDLLDATNRDVVSGDYAKWAAQQRKAALGWTITTVAVGLITVAALVAVVITAKNDSVQFLLSKTTVGIIGLIVAGYTARQAAEHRREERTANRLALDLAALEPFLEHIDDPQKLRSEIAERVFVPKVSTREDEPRFTLRRRSMTLTEIMELLTKMGRPPT